MYTAFKSLMLELQNQISRTNVFLWSRGKITHFLNRSAQHKKEYDPGVLIKRKLTQK